MARGAMVRPPARGAKLRSMDDAAARKMPGVIAVVRQGDVVGVVAERAEQDRAAAGAVNSDWHALPGAGPNAEVPMPLANVLDERIRVAAANPAPTYVLAR